MKKNNSYKLIEVLSLIVAVIGLTLGFAAYSTSVKVENLHVKPDKDTFVVKFSSSETSTESNRPIDGVASNGARAEVARIVSDNKTALAHLKARFTAPGQKVVYTLYAHNVGDYDAFLKTITFSNALGSSNFKSCRPYSADTSTSLVMAACEDISLKVEVGDSLVADGSVADISGHSLEVDDNEPIIITIEYDPNGRRSDGEFEVEFGKVTLTYLSVDSEGNKKIKSRIQE